MREYKRENEQPSRCKPPIGACHAALGHLLYFSRGTRRVTMANTYYYAEPFYSNHDPRRTRKPRTPLYSQLRFGSNCFVPLYEQHVVGWHVRRSYLDRGCGSGLLFVVGAERIVARRIYRFFLRVHGHAWGGTKHRERLKREPKTTRGK